MTATPATGAAEYEYRVYGNHLRVAAILSAALFCLAMSLLLEYSGGWAMALPFALPYAFIAIAPTRKASLSWALAQGWVYLAVFLLAALLVATTAETSRGVATGLAVCLAMMGAQLYAMLSARRVTRAARTLNRITGVLSSSGVFGVVYAVVWTFLAVVALPGTIRDREAANEASAVGAVRVMNIALATYKEDHGSLPEHVSLLKELVDERIACAEPPCTKAGYKFTYTLLAPDGSRPRYTVAAQPIKYGEYGKRSFYTDETGVVRFTKDDRASNANDPPFK